MNKTLIDALQNPSLYDHPVSGFAVIETHISWVLLTGDYAYKIKKPVDFGFLDFSSLEKRHHYCLEELRLNRRLAPELYLEVMPIRGTNDAPRFGDGPDIIEYAVKMKQFDERQRLDHLLAAGRLGPEEIDQLADELASFHGQAKRAGGDLEWGNVDRVAQPMLENFTQIQPLLADTATWGTQRARLHRIEDWTRARLESLRQCIEQRKAGGFVRECHGDAHLANMVLIDQQVVLFDCLEFNSSLRWIDVMSELAFVTMDLDDRGRPDLARRLRDRWLQRTGDYAGLALLRLYQVYRALVRAKVAALRLQQPVDQAVDAVTRAEFESYLALAETYTVSLQPVLICCYGVSGTGKTTVSQMLIERLALIRLRSDVERKRLFGLSLETKSGKQAETILYGEAMNRNTFDRLATLSCDVIGAGFSVIVDATFLKRQERQRFARLAQQQGCPFVILEIIAADALVRQRIIQRTALGIDASEADISILDRQLAWREPLSVDEREQTLTVHNDGELDVTEIITRLNTLAESRLLPDIP